MAKKVATNTMRISLATTFKIRPKEAPLGFSLVEIMVTLLIIAMIMVVIADNPFKSSRDLIKESINQLQRAIKVARDEATLTNKMTRLRFNVEKSPVEFIIESALDNEVYLLEEVDQNKLSQKDYEAYLKQKEELDSQFSPIEAEDLDEFKFNEGVDYLGVGLSDKKEVDRDNSVSIYFFPSGEKDAAIIFLGSEKEVGAFSINSFDNDFDLNYYSYQEENPNLDREIKDIQESIVTKQFEMWKKR